MAQTIITHQGAFKVKHLQFGVSVTPGVFQGLMESLLTDIPGIISFFDDVLIAGSSERELLNRLQQALFPECVKKEECQFSIP